MTDVTVDGTDAAEPPSLDPAALERLKRFGGARLLDEMIALFLVAAPQRIGAARVATESGDAPATELAMHSLKSSSAQLGAMRMQRLCEQGEQLARAGDLMIVGFLVQDLEDELVRVTEWLQRASTGGVK
jgi:HPt (histidine-containing phosphotransfer) domain-containing protein